MRMRALLLKGLCSYAYACFVVERPLLVCVCMLCCFLGAKVLSDIQGMSKKHKTDTAIKVLWFIECLVLEPYLSLRGGPVSQWPFSIT
jgi:hypothetical protein